MPTPTTPHPIFTKPLTPTKLTPNPQRGLQVRGRFFLSRTPRSRAPQKHTGPRLPLFFELESLLQPELERAGRVGGGPVRDVSDRLFHERTRFRVFEARNQELALRLHDLFLTGRRRQRDVDLGVRVW